MAFESDLGWYFGEGATAFERSTFGDQLERASMFSGATVPCVACGGVVCDDLPGVGFLASGSECPSCSGRGTLSRDMAQQTRSLTARPRSLRGGGEPGYVVSDRTLIRFATVSRVVAHCSALHARVLAAYYGDNGSKWGRTKQGRIFSVWPLTPSGARVCEQSRRRASKGAAHLPSDETLAVELLLQSQQPNDVRRLLLDKADREARVLHAEAVRTAMESWS